MTELSDLAARFAGAQRSGPRERQHGVYSGIVTDVLDPLRLGRVRVQVSGFNECDLPWARVALPMAGAGRGAFGSPRLGDEVLVAFEGGDPRQPYVIGFLWSARNTPPQDATPLQEYAVRAFRAEGRRHVAVASMHGDHPAHRGPAGRGVGRRRGHRHRV